jgi:hypothetical protein
MNAKHLTPLAVLAAVSIAATAWALRTSTPTVASDRRGENVVPSLLAKANDITGLSVRDNNGTVTVERRDNRFVAAESGYPIKTDTVRDVIASSAELAFEEARTADPNRYGDLGLADPGDKNASEAGKEITFRTAGGELADFVVGKTDATAGGPAGGLFIRVNKQPQTFLARGNVRLPAMRSDWFVPFDLDVKRSEVKKVELAGGGRDGLTATAKADKPGTLELAEVPENQAGRRRPQNGRGRRQWPPPDLHHPGQRKRRLGADRGRSDRRRRQGQGEADHVQGRRLRLPPAVQSRGSPRLDRGGRYE